MIDSIIKRTPYGEVLEEPVKLKNPKTFHSLVKDLSSVSFFDCSYDSKGAAFEYFVRATLKGKKLGQYFTPRELVQVMSSLVGREKIVNAVLSGEDLKVLDPACGTGGFLVFLMKDAIAQLDDKRSKGKILGTTYAKALKKIKEEIFFGSDANDGVAASAKMNMIIAGDGHTNIQHEDSLSGSSKNWSIGTPDCNLILTNPPFGTSESDSLSSDDKEQFSVTTAKGQYLFLQKMIECSLSNGEICTVIDEGVLNTDSGKDLRRFILQKCHILAIVNLPSETFKPNKINVKSSLLYLRRRETDNDLLDDNYKTTVCQLESLGYQGSGDKIRSFDFDKFNNEIATNLRDMSLGPRRKGYFWNSFDIDISEIYKDKTHRFDYKYWNTDIRNRIQSLVNSGMPSIKDLNLIQTSRGKSPSADSYVDQVDGYALVVKAGSNISKFGKIILEGSDWIEKSVYEEFQEQALKQSKNLNIIQKGDILLSSTGDGTLGKCAVYDLDFPAIADGHVTIIRVDPDVIYNYYLADYLRVGFGAVQIARFYTGSTGLIELTPDQVELIIVDTLEIIDIQKEKSSTLRELEAEYESKISEADDILSKVNTLL